MIGLILARQHVNIQILRRTLSRLLLACTLVTQTANGANYSEIYIPKPAFHSRDVAIITNVRDDTSQQIAEYYKKRRKIPEENIIRISFPPGIKVIPPKLFQSLKKSVTRQTPKSVQSYVLTWNQPYRVGCMSITTAFTAGYNKKFCATGCKPTALSPYYNSKSAKPNDDFGWRPTMVLAGNTLAEVKKLIDRGIASDYTYPQGTAYLLKTSDNARSTRAASFPATAEFYKGLWRINYLEKNYIEKKDDVMFYFTGLVKVPRIKTNHFLPGAIADHLTSTGGQLTDSTQMSILRWLEAGATASYGTVLEPCSFPEKFPNPKIIIENYISGSSLIEAYWKSVAWPGQGIFIGEPLAKPFGVRPGK